MNLAFLVALSILSAAPPATALSPLAPLNAIVGDAGTPGFSVNAGSATYGGAMRKLPFASSRTGTSGGALAGRCPACRTLANAAAATRPMTHPRMRERADDDVDRNLLSMVNSTGVS